MQKLHSESIAFLTCFTLILTALTHFLTLRLMSWVGDVDVMIRHYLTLPHLWVVHKSKKKQQAFAALDLPPCLVTFSPAATYICGLSACLYLGIARCAEYSLGLCKGLEHQLKTEYAFCDGSSEQKTPPPWPSNGKLCSTWVYLLWDLILVFVQMRFLKTSVS